MKSKRFLLAAGTLLAIAGILGVWKLIRSQEESASASRMTVYRELFPDLSETQISSLFDIVFRQEYTSWVDFRTEDIKTPLFNVEGLVRRTVPDTTGNVSGATEIYFFGGSTMQGTHVPDDRTLPAAFMQLAAKAGVSFRAVNYGQPYYYLKQEAQLFLSMLIDRRSPRVAVFLDGLNEVHEEGASYARISFFSNAYRYAIAEVADPPSLFQKIGRLVSRRSIPSAILKSGFRLPDGVSSDQGYQSIAASYVGNVKELTKICNAYGITCLFFLQPVPFLSYDRSRDPFADTRSFPKYKTVYDLIKEQLRNFGYFQAIDDAFLDLSEIAYVDHFHYSPRGNAKLAELIFAKVQKELTASRP